jgi:CTP synthase (UTP-ammonia lyase)
VNPIRIGLIGDRNLEVRAHAAIPRALDLAGKSLARPLEPVWLPTSTLGRGPDDRLTGLGGMWCVPGSPYENTEAALWAIQAARERPLPFLGTCGGFQHAILEFARNVLGAPGAAHAELSPAAKDPWISELSCSLVGASGLVRLLAGSKSATAYGKDKATEEYHCNYGLNAAFRERLEAGGLKIAGVDEAGEVRILELDEHPFFIATLFQPELSAYRGVPHPLVRAFGEAAFHHWHRSQPKSTG